MTNQGRNYSKLAHGQQVRSLPAVLPDLPFSERKKMKFPFYPAIIEKKKYPVAEGKVDEPSGCGPDK
jgi:hypothetical protein